MKSVHDLVHPDYFPAKHKYAENCDFWKWNTKMFGSYYHVVWPRMIPAGYTVWYVLLGRLPEPD